jgi:hypothetical protein
MNSKRNTTTSVKDFDEKLSPSHSTSSLRSITKPFSKIGEFFRREAFEPPKKYAWTAHFY